MLAQAALYVGGAVWAAERWPGWAVAGGLAGLGQLVALAGLWKGRRAWVGAGAGLSLLALLGAWGALLHVAWAVSASFGPELAGDARNAVLATLGVLPWVFAVPVEQLVYARWGWAAVAPWPLVLLIARPGATPAPGEPPTTEAAAVYAAWSGEGAGLAAGASTAGAPTPAAGPAEPGELRLTPLRAGRAGRTVRCAAADRARCHALLPPFEGQDLLVERVEGPLPLRLAAPGHDARRAEAESAALLDPRPRREELAPGVLAPRLDGETVRLSGALVSAAGAVPLEGGWARASVPGDAAGLVAELDAAIAAAAAHLVTNMRADDSFTYVVAGPSGTAKGGYNFPRHAGTAWFLARVALVDADPGRADPRGPAPSADPAAAGRGADRALDWLDRHSHDAPGDRRYVLDPDRGDGRSWIGSTSLALLAQLARVEAGDHRPEALARLQGWGRQVIASVDAAGMVRAEMIYADGSWPAQVVNPYGQGQAMLALAVLVRDGHGVGPLAEAPAALARTLRWVDTAYYGQARPPWVPDEHWMCLASHAAAEAGVGARSTGPGGLGPVGGRGVCATSVGATELPGATRTPMAAAPAGASAEAWLAHAWDTDAADAAAGARAWARLFLAAQYRAADAPRLGRPAALIGGFRDGPAALDVQIDGVQHIGAALLGVRAVVAGRARPGDLP